MNTILTLLGIVYVGIGFSLFLYIEGKIKKKYTLSVWIMGFLSLCFFWPFWVSGIFAFVAREHKLWSSIKNIARKLYRK